jgi:ferrous iron transport protein B
MPADLNTPFVALVGPPNAGKTTLFNALTGAASQPVNYPGATVEYAVGAARKSLGVELRIADTPGTYSLAPKSPEERVTFEILFGGPTAKPQAVILVVDGTQLSRHLPLVRQVLETGYPMVVAVTMKDLLERDGVLLDIGALSKMLTVPVFAVNGLDTHSVRELVGAVMALTRKPLPSRIPPTQWSSARQALELKWAGDIAAAVRLSGSSVRSQHRSLAEETKRIDRVLLHPVGGLFIFVAVMALLFTSIFWVAAPAMDAVNGLFEYLASAVLAYAPHSLWADFLAGGVLGSLGAILTFVPQIMILFLGISLLEDSGYLARAATLIDRPLTLIGLNGRSFVPLLSGYACAIPAMLAARTIPNRKERWLTLFIIPLMSCSARLPVYSLLLAYIFWGEPAWKPGVALSLIYLTTLVIGSIASALVSRLIKTEDPSFFMMELPLYRKPSPLGLLKSMAMRTESYLRKAGPAIFIFAVAIWVGTTFPHYDAPNASEKLNTSYAAQGGKLINPLMHPMGGDWRTGLALMTAFAAREVFVSSLGLVMQVSEEEEKQREVSLLGSMRQAKREDGSLLFTPASCVGLILFFMIALQCMATVAVARREFGSWKMPVIQLVAFNLLAYVVAVSAVQGLRWAGVP